MSNFLPNVADNAKGRLDSGLSASGLTITLEPGSNLPETKGAATSLGSSTVLESIGIGNSGIQVRDLIENLTDGSHAYVLSITEDSIETTLLTDGDDNTWSDGDEWVVGRFIGVINKYSNGEIVKSEKILINGLTGQTVTVGERGYDGDTPFEFDGGDYLEIFVFSAGQKEIHKAIGEAHNLIRSLQKVALSPLEKIAAARLLDFDLSYTLGDPDVTVAAGVYDSAGHSSASTPLTLTLSQTNYIQVNWTTGIISASTSGFTPATSIALWQVVCDGTGVTVVQDKRQIAGDYPGNTSAITAIEDGLTATENIGANAPVSISGSSSMKNLGCELQTYRKSSTALASASDYPRKMILIPMNNRSVYAVGRFFNSPNYGLKHLGINLSDDRTINTTNRSISAIDTFATSTGYIHSVSKVSSTKILIALMGATGIQQLTHASLSFNGQVNENLATVADGTALNLDSTNTYSTNGGCMACMVDTNVGAVVYNTASGKYIAGVNCSGTNPTIGTPVQLTSSSTSSHILHIVSIGTNKALVLYSDGTNTMAVVATFVGTAVSLSTPVIAVSGLTSQWDQYSLVSPFEEFGVTDTAFLFSPTSSTNSRFYSVSVAGTVPTASSAQNISINSTDNTFLGNLRFINANTIAYAGGTTTSSQLHLFNVRSGVVTNIYSESIPAIFDLTSIGDYAPGIAAMPDGSIILSVGISATLGNGYVVHKKFIKAPYGITKAAVTNGNSGNIVTKGLATLGQSFTPGDEIYIGPSGDLSTTKTENVKLGTMRTSTQILLK